MKLTNSKIISLLHDGFSQKQIADKFHVHHKTVQYRLKCLRLEHRCISTLQLIEKLSTLRNANFE